jgi:hypothetical protein
MGKANMFDLEQAIAEWRERMAEGGITSAETLDELEAHLREEIERQVRTGAESKSAFEWSADRIGRASELKREFDRATPSGAVTIRRLKQMTVVMVGGYAALTAAVVYCGADLPLGVRLMGAVGMTLPLIIFWSWRRFGRYPFAGSCSVAAVGALGPGVGEALKLGRKEAEQFGHNYIGTEHVLLGLMKLTGDGADSILRRLGLDAGAVRREVERIVETGRLASGRRAVPCTPRARRAMELAAREARARKQTKVSPDHMLLGLVLEGDGIAARVLEKLGVDAAKVRQAGSDENRDRG